MLILKRGAQFQLMADGQSSLKTLTLRQPGHSMTREQFNITGVIFMDALVVIAFIFAMLGMSLGAMAYIQVNELKKEVQEIKDS